MEITREMVDRAMRKMSRRIELMIAGCRNEDDAKIAYLTNKLESYMGSTHSGRLADSFVSF